MKTENFLTTVPFDGFYHSLHDSEIDHALEIVFDIGGSGDVNPDILEAARDALDWPCIYEAYAKEYAESIGHEYDLELTFESLSSPRFYNFETDRAFSHISRDSLAKIWRAVPRDALRDAIRERFTSRDGFISHYPNSLDDWPRRLSDWDHNQIGTLLWVYLDHEVRGYVNGGFDGWAQLEVMESAFGNGFIENLFFDPDNARRGYEKELNRLDAINRYLHERNARPVKTLEQWHAARRAENRPFSATPLGGYALA